MMYGWGYGGPMSWGGMILGPIFMILLIVLAAVIVAWVLRAVGLGWNAGPPARSAIDILNERFARGEIDKGEFEERRKILLGS